VGALAATYCLEQPGPQGHHYSRAQFVQRYGEVYGDPEAVSVIRDQSSVAG
jgi:adenosine kinase